MRFKDGVRNDLTLALIVVNDIYKNFCYDFVIVLEKDHFHIDHQQKS